jgi:hypothetical protein
LKGKEAMPKITNKMQTLSPWGRGVKFTNPLGPFAEPIQGVTKKQVKKALRGYIKALTSDPKLQKKLQKKIARAVCKAVRKQCKNAKPSASDPQLQKKVGRAVRKAIRKQVEAILAPQAGS